MAQTNEYICGCIITTGLANIVIELCHYHKHNSDKLIILANNEISWSGEITA